MNENKKLKKQFKTLLTKKIPKKPIKVSKMTEEEHTEVALKIYDAMKAVDRDYTTMALSMMETEELEFFQYMITRIINERKN